VSTGFLTSFHYYRDKDMAEIGRQLRGFKMFADSGAFSAKSLGAEIKLDDYLAWLARWRSLFAVYANLDVIRDPEATWRNHLEMERQGFHPLPVLHGGTPWDYLERYIERGDTYIALGGLVGAPAVAKRWIIKAFQVADGRAVFHGFGRTNLSDIADFPWYSVDSSSWGMGFRYGQINLFDRGRWVKIRVGDHAGVYKNATLLRQHGVAPERIADRSLYHWRYACWASAIAWHRLGQWAHRRHAPVVIPGRPDADAGPNLYLAEGTGGGPSLRLPVLAEAIRSEQDAGPHLYLADTATGPNLRVPVAADAIRSQTDPGPHLYLANAACGDRILPVAADAVRSFTQDPGPHLYLAPTATGPNLAVPVAADAIRSQVDPGQEGTT